MTELIDAQCPVCCELLEDFRSVDTTRPPSAGAWAICCHCAEVLRFRTAPDGLALRRTTLAERSSREAPTGLEDALRIVLAKLPSRH